MGANSPRSKALALEPVDIATPDADAVRPVAHEPAPAADPQRDLRMTTADEFLAAAAKEYETGKIDRALWRQAVDQFGKDPSLVIAAYLRARAKALKPAHKPDQDRPIQSSGAASIPHAEPQARATAPRAEIVSPDVATILARGGRRKLLYLAGAAAALASTVAIAYWMVSPRQGDSSRTQIASVATPSTTPSAPQSLPGSEQAVVKNSSPGTAEGGPERNIAATVRQLKDVGNWNVLVLYAAEWTRKEPDNAVAWSNLSVGYSKLRQYNDALDAAAKAVQLAPEDAAAWRNVGQINLAVDRLPEAGIAFARALAVSPDDADARCGAAWVAQRQARPKDAGASARPIGPADGSCPDPGNAGNVAVSASVPVVRKPISTVGR
jgi:tetratricopeptide (TPR) repeat protein